jgi:hypothetical protein
MNKDQVYREIIANYILKRDASPREDVMAFHRENIFMHMRRFIQFLSCIQSPSSEILYNVMFLMVKATSYVARNDWEICLETGMYASDSWGRYFTLFDELASGLVPFDEYADLCLTALIQCDDT